MLGRIAIDINTPHGVGHILIRYLAIATIALSGVVHLLIVPDQFTHAFAHGSFFIFIGVAQLLWAVGFWRYPSCISYWAVLALSG